MSAVLVTVLSDLVEKQREDLKKEAG